MLNQIAIGERAPEFELRCCAADGEAAETVSLDSYRGKWLALIFYARDFSFVCPTEITAIAARWAEFERLNCEVLGVNSDSIESHQQWIKAPSSAGGLDGSSIPLASDESMQVIRAFGAFDSVKNCSHRALCVIDPRGNVQYATIHNSNVGRSANELLRIVSALQSGGLCAAEWMSGDSHVDITSLLLPGRVIGNFEILAPIGSGGYGTVFSAKDLVLNREVALKVLNPEAVSSAVSVLHEARAAAGINHPNVCTIYAVDDSTGVPMIAMEHIAGRTLRQRLQSGPIPLRKAVAIGRQMATGLAAAHERGVSHGDLKPGNVMIDSNGVVKVLDFGIAHIVSAVEDEESDERQIVGTPAYMSPEQTEGHRPSPRSDVFSLGLMLYELVTGQHAVTAKSPIEQIKQVRTLDPDGLAKNVPSPFAEVMEVALIRSSNERRVTMSMIAAMLGSRTKM